MNLTKWNEDILFFLEEIVPKILKEQGSQANELFSFIASSLKIYKKSKFIGYAAIVDPMFKNRFFVEFAKKSEFITLEFVLKSILEYPLDEFYNYNSLTFKDLYEIYVLHPAYKKYVYTLAIKILGFFLLTNNSSQRLSVEMIEDLLMIIEKEEIVKRSFADTGTLVKNLCIDTFQRFSNDKKIDIQDYRECYIRLIPYIFKYNFIGDHSNTNWLDNLIVHYGKDILNSSNSSFKLFYQWVESKKPMIINNAVNLINVFGVEYYQVESNYKDIINTLIKKISITRTIPKYHANIFFLISKLLKHYKPNQNNNSNNNNNLIDRSQSEILFQSLREITQSMLFSKIPHRFLSPEPFMNILDFIEPSLILDSLESMVIIATQGIPTLEDILYKIFKDHLDLIKKHPSYQKIYDLVSKSNLYLLYFAIHPIEAEMHTPNLMGLQFNPFLWLELYRLVTYDPERFSSRDSFSILEFILARFSFSIGDRFSHDFLSRLIRQFIRTENQLKELIDSNFQSEFTLSKVLEIFPEKSPKLILENPKSENSFSLFSLHRHLNTDGVVKRYLLKSNQSHDGTESLVARLLLNHGEFPEIYIEHLKIFGLRISSNLSSDLSYLIGLHDTIMNAITDTQYPIEVIQSINLQVFKIFVSIQMFAQPIQLNHLRYFSRDNYYPLIGRSFTPLVEIFESFQRDLLSQKDQDLIESTFLNRLNLSSDKEKYIDLKAILKYKNHSIFSELFDPEKNGGIRIIEETTSSISSNAPHVQNLIYQHILSFVFEVYNQSFIKIPFIKYSLVSKSFFEIIKKLISKERGLFNIDVPSLAMEYLRRGPRIENNQFSLLSNGFYTLNYNHLKNFYQSDMHFLLNNCKELVITQQLLYNFNEHDQLDQLHRLKITFFGIELEENAFKTLFSKSPNLSYLKITRVNDNLEKLLKITDEFKIFDQLNFVHIIMDSGSFKIQDVHSALSSIKAEKETRGLKFDFYLEFSTFFTTQLSQEMASNISQYVHKLTIAPTQFDQVCSQFKNNNLKSLIVNKIHSNIISHLGYRTLNVPKLTLFLDNNFKILVRFSPSIQHLVLDFRNSLRADQMSFYPIFKFLSRYSTVKTLQVKIKNHQINHNSIVNFQKYSYTETAPYIYTRTDDIYFEKDDTEPLSHGIPDDDSCFSDDEPYSDSDSDNSIFGWEDSSSDEFQNVFGWLNPLYGDSSDDDDSDELW